MQQTTQCYQYKFNWKPLLFLILLSTGIFIQAQEPATRFSTIIKDFPRKEKNLRKWDIPTFADLDQDGYTDMLLNDHGLGVSVYWNNEGKFAFPYDIIMGDLHGISVGDIDQDGLLEVIMSRGGGSGSNARNSKLFKVTENREFIPIDDLDTPLAFMRGRTVKFFDGDNDGDLDLINFAFPSKEMKGKSENYIYENPGNGQLVIKSRLPETKGDGQKVCLADVNNDQLQDIIIYGNDHLRIFKNKGDLNFMEVTDKLLSSTIKDVTYVAAFDYDNDGDLDLFMTRGKDFNPGDNFYNKATATWGFYTRRGDFNFPNLEAGDVLQMYNFQSQWPYNDAYYIGETGYPYDFPGETHSGKDIRLVSSNALGFPDTLNPDGGIHIGYVGNNEWRIAGNTFSPTTGTVIGVNNRTETIVTDGLENVLLENKNGKFRDITKQAKLIAKEHSVAIAIADINLDGHQDILVAQRGDLVHKNPVKVWENKGDGTFIARQDHGLVTNDIGSIGMALGTLDYDLDGDMDVVIGNERGKWHLFTNSMEQTNANNSITVHVGNSPKRNASALGAKITLKNCQGTQVRFVGNTAASYSLDFDPNMVFGLGNCQTKSTISIGWSNGESLNRTITNTQKTIHLGK